jgi:hypothetical protein
MCAGRQRVGGSGWGEAAGGGGGGDVRSSSSLSAAPTASTSTESASLPFLLGNGQGEKKEVGGELECGSDMMEGKGVNNACLRDDENCDSCGMGRTNESRL